MRTDGIIVGYAIAAHQQLGDLNQHAVEFKFDTLVFKQMFTVFEQQIGSDGDQVLPQIHEVRHIGSSTDLNKIHSKFIFLVVINLWQQLIRNIMYYFSL